MILNTYVQVLGHIQDFKAQWPNSPIKHALLQATLQNEWMSAFIIGNDG